MFPYSSCLWQFSDFSCFWCLDSFEGHCFSKEFTPAYWLRIWLSLGHSFFLMHLLIYFTSNLVEDGIGGLEFLLLPVSVSMPWPRYGWSVFSLFVFDHLNCVDQWPVDKCDSGLWLSPGLDGPTGGKWRVSYPQLSLAEVSSPSVNSKKNEQYSVIVLFSLWALERVVIQQ